MQLTASSAIRLAILCLAVSILAFRGKPVSAQVTDSRGLITSSNWLVLGPFKQLEGCGVAQGDLLKNFIAPSAIPCEYPEANQEVEYDSFIAASIKYLGPVNANLQPHWRPFSDGIDDGENNLLEDDGFDCQIGSDEACDRVMSWLATYVEYKGTEPIQVDLCAGITDGAQIWIDNSLVYNRPGCRAREVCGDRVEGVTIQPGVHRIAAASFSGQVEWGLSLGLEEGGVPITDATADWVFHGKSRPVFDTPPCPALVSPIAMLTCQVNGERGIDLEWENPVEAISSQRISVQVDGTEVEVLPGAEVMFTLPAATFPDLSEHEVCVINESGIGSCCHVELMAPVVLDVCKKNEEGGVDLEWQNPFNASADQAISIQINGTEVSVVGGVVTGITIPADAIPDDVREICVVNERGVPVCCSLEATDDEGLITTRNWLVLGPFLQDVTGCDGRDRDHLLLQNFIAPGNIRCLYPLGGESLEYDSLQAASTGYVGPTLGGFPVWRAFKDGTPDDGLNDLASDPARPGDREAGLMSWLVTYVEYRGAGPIEVNICLGVDDAVKLFVDDQLVFHRNVCGVVQTCEISQQITLYPGVHRIALSAFNAEPGWGASFGLKLGDDPILDDSALWPDWVFHGRRYPPSNFPCSTGVPEVCDSGQDEDGDGLTDCDDPDCASSANCRGTLFRRGDDNGDGIVDVSDPINNLAYQFLGNFTPPCLKALDFDDNGIVDVSDPIGSLNFQFSGGPSPAEPFASCGVDTKPDSLSCNEFPRCKG